MTDESALFCSAKYGYFEELEKLLKIKNINVDIKNIEGMTPLMISAKLGHIKCVELLLINNANPNIRNYKRDTALHCAINHLQPILCIDIVKLLISYNASINAVNNKHENAIMKATKLGNLELVKLLDNGVSINIKDIFGNNLLHHACFYGYINIVKYLVERYDKEILNEYNLFLETPLSIAIEYGYRDIIKYLLYNGSEICNYNKNGNSLLHIAIQSIDNKNGKDIALLIIEKSKDINTKNDKGKTAIMIACERNLEDIVYALLDKSPNIKNKDMNGKTCLSYSLENKNDKITCMLISYDSSVIKVENIYEEDHFMQSCRSSLYATKLIYSLYNKTNLSKKNKYGDTALNIAINANDIDIVKYLLTLGINPREINNNGENATSIALIQALRFNSYSIVKELRKHFLIERVIKSINLVPDICAICLNQTDEVELKCGHKYHIYCLLEYIEHQSMSCKCCLCRQNILL